MLRPASRPERVARRLRFAMVDIRQGEEVKRLIGKVGPRSGQERLEEVRDIARRAGVAEAEVIPRLGYKEIVEDATNTLGPAATVVLFSWKMCSGIAHGDLWPTLSVAERVELPGGPPGLGTFKVSANVQALMYVATFATHITRQGWHLYDERSRPPF
jgi:hypothetical protein